LATILRQHQPTVQIQKSNSLKIQIKTQQKKYTDYSRRIETLQQDRENSFKLRPVEQPTIPEVEISTLPQDITGNTHFYRTYGNKAIYEVPLEELTHEVVFLRLLNKLPGLNYNTIKEGVEAAVRIHLSLTPIEIFYQWGYKTYFSPTNSTGYPDPSPIPESFSNPFRTIESTKQPHARDS
jgi:hypothetical protein